MDIARFTADAPLEEMQAALREVGILIVEKLVPDDTMDRIESEIAPDLEAKEPGGGKFFGFKCKRLGGAVGRSPTFAHHRPCRCAPSRQLQDLPASDLGHPAGLERW
jgi:hypothetical protein